MVFLWSCMDVRVGLWRRLSSEELMLLNCAVGENSWKSLGLQGDPINSFWRISALGFLWKEWCWSWSSSTLATSCEELTHWKDSDSGKDWGQEEKGTTEDEMAGCHHRLDGLEFEWTPGDGDGQGGLVCCDSRGRKESDTTKRLNWTEQGYKLVHFKITYHWINIVSSMGGNSENSKLYSQLLTQRLATNACLKSKF